MLEILSGKVITFGKLIKVPKMKIHQIQNLATCLKVCVIPTQCPNVVSGSKLVVLKLSVSVLKVSLSIFVVNAHLEDIQQGNTKLILGLVWLLILRFQIEEGGGGGTQELLDWCNSVLNPQVFKIHEMMTKI